MDRCYYFRNTGNTKPIFEFPVFSIKDRRNYSSLYIAQSRWATFCIGGRKGNVLFKFLQEAFEEYWRSNDVLLEYMLFDYLIELAFRNNKAIRKMINSIPVNNRHCNSLRDGMLADAPISKLDNYLYEDTLFYKLSWKSHYGIVAKNGEESIYASIIRD